MEPVCARCPKRLGRSCCEVREGESLATLTGADLARITEATGLAPRRFARAEWLSDEEARDYERHRPLFAGYFRHLPRRLTLKVERGACVFHRADGCALPAEARPLACRLYPFEPVGDELRVLPERQGDLTAAASAPHACLAVEESDSLEALLARFGVDRDSLAELAARLAREVSEHARQTAPGGRLRDLAVP